MRIHRLISILLLVESRGKIKARELASKLEISERTVYRDIDTLCETGFPLTTTTGPNGGIHFMDGNSVGIRHLHEDDFKNLYLSGIGLQPDKQSDMAIKLNNAVLKLQKYFSSEQGNDLNKMGKRFYFDDQPWWGNNRRVYHLDILIQAIFQSKVLNITYQKYKGEQSTRRIHPYGIVVKRMDWYLVAYCEKSNEIRTFKCERIAKAEISDEAFHISETFSMEEYWNESEKSFKHLCAEDENYPVNIKIHQNHADLLSDLEVLSVDEDGSYVLATINLYGYDHAIDAIMKMIGYAEVIRPLELRKFVEEELEIIIKKYKNSTVLSSIRNVGGFENSY